MTEEQQIALEFKNRFGEELRYAYQDKRVTIEDMIKFRDEISRQYSRYSNVNIVKFGEEVTKYDRYHLLEQYVFDNTGLRGKEARELIDNSIDDIERARSLRVIKDNLNKPKQKRGWFW